MDITIGDGDNEESFTKKPSMIEEIAYRDTWGKGADSFIAMIYERLKLIHDLLAEDGSIYVHCDYRVSGYLRLVLDEVMGKNNFVNEIIWTYEDIGGRAIPYFKRKHDVIFLYQKSDSRVFNVQRKGLAASTIERFAKYFDKNGQITYRSLRNRTRASFQVSKVFVILMKSGLIKMKVVVHP
jgi:hypothetical protein